MCPLNRLFEDQARARPDAVAVTFDGQHLSYAALNDRANRVARRLQLLGVEPGSIVALCAERSLELVVGILGILKAGAAYLPLDPRDPKDRLEFMLADTAASVLLTHQAVGVASELSGIKIVLLEDVLGDPDLHGSGQSGRSDFTGQPGLRHLHVGLDRSTQRRTDYTRQRRAAAKIDRDAVSIRSGRCLDVISLVCL